MEVEEGGGGCLTSQKHGYCVSGAYLLRQFDVLPH